MKSIQWSYFQNPVRDMSFSEDYKQYYESEWWKNIREQQLLFDNHSCSFCGCKDKLQVHHIYGLKHDHPCCGDITTLCQSCHEALHKKQDFMPINERNRFRFAVSFVSLYLADDYLFGGNDNLCKIETIRKLWHSCPPLECETVQIERTSKLVSELRREHAAILLFSGYSKHDIKAITNYSDTTINNAYLYLYGFKKIFKGDTFMKRVDMTNVQEAGEYKSLPAGAYTCIIRNVEDFPKKEYLKVTYDIAVGEYKGYYDDIREKHPDWEWVGAYVKSYKQTALPMLKRFCSAVSKSNGSFVFDGNTVNADEKTLIGKKLGLVLAEEEYYSNSGEKKVRLFVDRECPLEMLDKVKVPDRKLLKEDNIPKTSSTPADGFINVPEGSAEEIPWGE